MNRPTLLRLLRFALGLTLDDVAQLSGIDLADVGRMERGVRPMTSRSAERILRALGPGAEDLVPLASKFLAKAERARKTAWARRRPGGPA